MPEPIRQILPGVVHWAATHPNLGVDVSSYALTESGVLLDPMTPADGLDWFEDNDVVPQAVLLTNRHHLRETRAFVERYGCTVHASRPGMHEFDAQDRVTPFEFGDTLPGDVVAHEVGVLCPDETALEIPDVRALAVADGVINYDGLTFVPDNLLGDDPGLVRRGLIAAYAKLVDEVDFDHLLLAHGPPVVGTGRQALRDFCGQ
jgi:hypothetical protein